MSDWLEAVRGDSCVILTQRSAVVALRLEGDAFLFGQQLWKEEVVLHKLVAW